MIQRVQSIYLILSAISCGLMTLVPFAAITTKGKVLFEGVVAEGDLYTLDVFGVHYLLNEHQVELMGLWYIAAMVACACTISIIAIFLFKNRSLQITICKLNLLVYLGVILAISLSADTALSYVIDLGMEGEVEYQLGAAFPIVSAILVFLATRAIKKDDELVRSADRIR